jgi:serine/threonine protein kinase
MSSLGRSASQGEKPPARGTIFSVGEVLSGIYLVRGLLGEGSMAQVFDVHDRQLNRESAVKVYWPVSRAEEGDLGDLILREAQVLAAIQHPGLATVYNVGRHDDLDYLVMERIRGIGLDAEMAQRHRVKGRVPIRETIRILLAVAEALGAVHGAGCLHRDLKPSNVMLAGRERVVLMDFGLFLPEGALAFRPDPAGSPSYMAPESFSDAVMPGAGHLVDLYALGVMGFELLTARLPFRAASVEETAEQHISAPVPDLRVICPGAPPRLSALIADLLSKDPYDRPTSEEVVWRLRAVRDEFEGAARRALTPVR